MSYFLLVADTSVEHQNSWEHVASYHDGTDYLHTLGAETVTMGATLTMFFGGWGCYSPIKQQMLSHWYYFPRYLTKHVVANLPRTVVMLP